MQIYGLNQGHGGHGQLRRLHEWCLFKIVLTGQVLNLVLTGQDKTKPVPNNRPYVVSVDVKPKTNKIKLLVLYTNDDDC